MKMAFQRRNDTPILEKKKQQVCYTDKMYIISSKVYENANDNTKICKTERLSNGVSELFFNISILTS